jgi:hypothetical protein
MSFKTTPQHKQSETCESHFDNVVFVTGTECFKVLYFKVYYIQIIHIFGIFDMNIFSILSPLLLNLSGCDYCAMANERQLHHGENKLHFDMSSDVRRVVFFI